MTPKQARMAYGRQIAAHGETVSLHRRDESPVSIKARLLKSVTASDVAGNDQQIARRFLVLAEDVDASDFSLPFRARQDRIVWDGRTLAITSVDDSTRRVGGVLIAYELHTAGP